MLDGCRLPWFASRMTPKQHLLEVLRPSVADEVSALLAAGKSWRQVAGEISSRAGVTVSHESMRQWYGCEEAA